MRSSDAASPRLCVECLQSEEDCECPQGFTDPEALAEYLQDFVTETGAGVR